MLGRAVAGSIQSVAGDCQPMARVQVDRIFGWIGGLLLPPGCVLCGQPGQRPCLDLCADCDAGLPVDHRALRAGPPPLDRCFAPFAYAFPADHLVHLLKYRGQLAVGRVLGHLLARAVRDRGLHLDVDRVVPVPLHASRHAERGFNQSAEIARRVAQHLQCRYDECSIGRVHATRPQVGLRPGERRANLLGAFRASGNLRGQRVAVVDDVLTTGATARAVAAALVEAGASSVDVWCIARAVAPERLDCPSGTEASRA
jgi:ComF family protein